MFNKESSREKYLRKKLVLAMVLGAYFLNYSFAYSALALDSSEKTSKGSNQYCLKNLDFQIISVPSSNSPEKHEWVLIVDINKIDVNSFKNAVIEVKNETSEKKYKFVIGNGACIRDNVLVISQPDDIEFYVKAMYNIKISGIKYKNGENVAIERRLLLVNRNKEVKECDIRSDAYKIDYKKKIIKGVKPLTTCVELVSKLSFNGYNWVIKPCDGRRLKVLSTLKTGDAIIFTQKGQAKFKFSIAVAGDITGCGKITKKGARLLKEYLLGKKEISEPYLSAADMNGNGKVESIDLLIIRKRLSEPYKKNGDVVQ